MRHQDPMRYGAQFYQDELINPLTYYKKKLKRAEALLRIIELSKIDPQLKKEINEYFQR